MQDTKAAEQTFTTWREKNFTPTPQLKNFVEENPQAWVPNNGSGVPIAGKDVGKDIVWQLPACILVPFTKVGPEKSETRNGGLYLSGFEHSKLGAIVAAYSLVIAAASSKDRAGVLQAASGVDKQQAESTIALAKLIAKSKPDFTEGNPPVCKKSMDRSSRYKVISYSDDSAVVDYFSPISAEKKGWSFRASVHWDGNDWKLDPQSITAANSAVEQVVDSTKGTGYKVDLSDYIAW